MSKVLVVGSLSSSLLNFRGQLLYSMLSAGHTVEAAAANLTEDRFTSEALLESDIAIHDISFERSGINPFKDFKVLMELVFLVRTVKPDVLISYTIKPVIYCNIATRIVSVPSSYSIITGLGYAFTGSATGKRWFVQLIARKLYGFSLKRTKKIFFQNPDDAALFQTYGIVHRRKPMVVVNGSGVDLNYFQPTPLPKLGFKFLLIARLLGDKGVREYAQAARIVKASYPEVIFYLVGDIDSNPDSITIDEVNKWHADNVLSWKGHADDVRSAISDSHVYVLPSYREGIPRTVLEAMAMGRAIITTDAPGCRETVEIGVNGFLVRIKDPIELAEAMFRFIREPALVEKMGRRSLEIAHQKFDVKLVNKVLMSEMGL